MSTSHSSLCLRHGAWIVLLSLCIHQADARETEHQVSQYVRDRWGSDRGLQGEVHAITQTADGYLWIGTDKGLFRFDGSEFLSVTNQAPAAPPITQVLGLTVDAQGNLIVRLPDRNLLRYANGAFVNTLQSLQPRELAITSIARTNDRAILASGLTNGVLRYSGEQFAVAVPVTALPASPVTSLAQSSDGKIWIGTRDSGLFYADGGRVTGVAKGVPGRRINTLLAIGAEVWIGTDAGVARWNGTQITAEGIPPTLRSSVPLAMLKDRHSNLWVGTRTGVLRINARGIPSADTIESKTDAVNTLFEDREGNLWLGGPWGIERLRDGSFATYGRAEGLPSDQNGAIFSDSDGRTWFAPVEGGLYWLLDGKQGRVTEAGLASDTVYSIGRSSDGLWVGRQKGGLTHLRWQNGVLLAQTYTQAEGLAQNSVYSVYESRDGTVWAGTLNQGASRIQGGRVTTYRASDGLASNAVTSILETTDGTMWFATPDGLRSLSNDRWRKYNVPDGLPSDDVNCLLEDSGGVLWIGTSGGLGFLSAGQIKTFRQTTAALHGQIFGVVEDKSGWLWIVTSKEVVRVHREKLLRDALDDEDIREYGIADGLRSVGGIRRHRSMVADSSGRIWISTSSGLSLADPAELARSTEPALVHLLSASADGGTIDLASIIKLPNPPRRLTFAYSGLSLRSPDRVRFRYRLDSYDRGWSEPTAAHEATYTNIGPGSYRFRVIARNADGVWNTEETVTSLEIEPLLWQTWWFRLSVVAICGLGVLAVYRWRFYRLTAQLNLRFEERLEERTRIAQELHDTLLQGFLSASMRLHVLVDQLPDESPEKESLSGVLDLIRRVTEEGRKTLRGLRSPGDVPLDLQQAFSQLQNEVAMNADIGFRVIVGGLPCPLHPILRDEVYRIGREALINAVRHSSARNIEIELEYRPRELRVVVRDDGRGIDSQVMHFGREGHFGLAGMRERAERIGGRLRVYSGATAGTEVELSVPSHVAFEHELPGVLQRWRNRRRQRTGSEKI